MNMVFNYINLTAGEYKLIDDIVLRAFNDIRTLKDEGITPLSLNMDLCAVHWRFRLDLLGLLNSGFVDFAHDITGIISNIDRETGDLDNYFHPRYAVKYSSKYNLHNLHYLKGSLQNGDLDYFFICNNQMIPVMDCRLCEKESGCNLLAAVNDEIKLIEGEGWRCKCGRVNDNGCDCFCDINKPER